MVTGRTYLIPTSPVSTNHSHIETRGGKRIPKQSTLDFKEFVKWNLGEEDRAQGGRLSFSAYKVEVWFFYEPEWFFTDGVPEREKALHADPVLQRRDTSNGIKVLEDAVFEYLESRDEKVLTLTVHKRAVRKLPAQPWHYTDLEENVVPGTIVIDVSYVNGTSGEEANLAKVERAVGPIELVWNDAVQERRESGLPTWYVRSPQDIDTDPSEFAYESVFDSISEVPRSPELFAYLSLVRSAMVDVAAGAFGEDFESKFFSSHSTLVRRHGVMTRGNMSERAFFDLDEWGAEFLIRESSLSYVKRVRYLNELSGSDGGWENVLVYPSLGGGLATVFDDADVHMYSVHGASEALLAERYTGYDSHVVDKYHSVPSGLGSYDAIICLDFLDTHAHPFELLEAFHGMLNRGGVLVLSYTFKQKVGGVKFPWVRTSPPRADIQKFLIAKRSLNMEVLTSFRDDLKVLRRK